MRGIDWIKIAIYMFEDEKMRLFDALVERDLIVYLWLRLLLQAGKVNDNGLIYLKEDVPYTKEMLSILFNRPIALIEKVLNLLESYEMIEIYENNIIRICNWEKHQNVEGMKKVREINKERTRNCRARKKIENKENNQDESCNNIKDNDNMGKKNSVVDENNIKNKDNLKDKSRQENNNDEKNFCNLDLSQNCNANVTEQKEKREVKKKKLELDIEERELRDIAKDSLSNNTIHKNGTKESKVNSQKVFRSYEDLKEKGFMLHKELEENNVKIKGLTLNWILERLSIHEEKYIHKAINIAIQRNKVEISYITGILKNWLKEGYPKTYEEMEFGRLKEKQKFSVNNFEPRAYDYKDLEERLLGWKK